MAARRREDTRRPIPTTIAAPATAKRAADASRGRSHQADATHDYPMSGRLVSLERRQLVAAAALRRLAPTAQIGRGEAEQVEDAAQRVVDHLLEALLARVERRDGRRDD